MAPLILMAFISTEITLFTWRTLKNYSCEATKELTYLPLTWLLNTTQGCFIVKPRLISWQYGVFCFDKETEYFASFNGFLIKSLKRLKCLSRSVFVSRNDNSIFDSKTRGQMLCVVSNLSLRETIISQHRICSLQSFQ